MSTPASAHFAKLTAHLDAKTGTERERQPSLSVNANAYPTSTLAPPSRDVGIHNNADSETTTATQHPSTAQLIRNEAQRQTRCR